MKKKYELKGYFYALGSTLIWSGNFIIARGLSNSIHPVELAFWRWLVAVLVFLPFGLKPFLKEKEVIKKNIPYLILTSILGISLFNTLIYFAGHTTTALNLSLISVTFPIFIIILSRFLFGESITIHKLIGIILVVTGIVLLVSDGDFSRLANISFAIGDLWMLIAAFIFAVYSILLRRKPDGLSVISLQMTIFLLGLFFLTPFFIWKSVITPTYGFETKTVLSILYVAIFASLIAFVLWNKSIEKIGPAKSGMIYYTLPLFSGILAFLILRESLTLIHLFSSILIITGIVIANSRQKEK